MDTIIPQNLTFSSLRHMRWLARRIQSRLLSLCPAARGVSRFRAVQMGLVPSQGDIMQALHRGAYREFIS